MSICKKYNCEECQYYKNCGGCEKCNATPLDKNKEQCICVRLINEKGFDGFQNTFQRVIDEINALGIPGVHVDDLNVIPGAFINLDYPLPNGNTAKFLMDGRTYFATQIDIDEDRFYGIVTDGSFILVVSYANEGVDPKIVLYKSI